MTLKCRFLLVFSLFSGCGYSARKGDVSLGGVEKHSSQKIFVPVVDNLTVRTGFESIVTTALRNILSTVKGVQLVEHEDQADYYLLGTIMRHQLVTNSTRLGTPATEAAGGLVANQSTAQDLRLTLRLRVQLVEKIPDKNIRREIWSRTFEKEGTFEASGRVVISGGGTNAGTESAPHIIDAREQIQVKLLADALARQVLDQVVQDF